MEKYRVTVKGNTYELKIKKKVVSGMWVRGKAQNLSKDDFVTFLILLLEKLHG